MSSLFYNYPFPIATGACPVATGILYLHTRTRYDETVKLRDLLEPSFLEWDDEKGQHVK